MSSMPPSLPSLDVACSTGSQIMLVAKAARTYAKNHRETLHTPHVRRLEIALSPEVNHVRAVEAEASPTTPTKYLSRICSIGM